ncbi:MAG: DUF4175 family protein [Gemmatimonadetes bacterium]|nr:DUF4175 family protein [Gemmatimonadota bacterium]
MSGKAGRAQVLDVVRSVKRRWRLRVMLRGLTYALALTLAATFLSSLALERLRFAPTAVLWLRVLTWGTLAVSVWAYLLRPLLRRVTDTQVALYLEEHEPSLEHTVVSALDADETRHPSPALARRVAETALERARRVDFGRRVEQPRLYRFGGMLTAVAVAGVALVLLGPVHLRSGVTALLVPTRDAGVVNPFTIDVSPGDVTIPRRTDQLISARLSGFDAAEASVFTRTSPDAPFQRMSMLTAEDGGFQLMLLGVDQRTQYFVEASGVRSPTYTIDVAELPYVDRLDLVYHFPAYTGLEPRTVEDGGDVAALPGTVVEVHVTPTLPAAGGRLILDGKPGDSLATATDGTLVGRFTVTRKGFYSVDLARSGGAMANASPEYTIDVLKDREPTVEFTKPGRDTHVSPIEEVYLQMHADDDYGIGDVRLVYSTNGGPEDTVPVFRASGAPLADVSAGHTLYLEDLGLEPGDLISYYAIARDNRGPGATPVASDMYFLQIRPFEHTYRQGQSNPGAGQGQGQGQTNQALSEMERQIIAATFNLVRQKGTYPADEFSQNVVSVGLAQERLRGQVHTLVQRMHERGVADSDPGVHDVAAILPRADSAMVRAKARLDDEDLKGAIPEEQVALRFLQQAEDTYDRVVVQQRSQGGGGGGQQQAADDLADLFQLQMDKLKNQYETVQRGEEQRTDDQVDALLEKLKELARRQQQEAERQRQQGQPGAQGSAASGAGGGDQQRNLADQAEEAARQLERLARQNGDPDLQETARRLQEAADAMRRAAARSGSAAQAEVNTAAARLEDARRRLEQAQSQRARRDAENAMREADDLARQQRGVEQDVRNLPESGQGRADAISRLRDRKDQMTGAVSDLEKQLDRAATVSRGQQPEAAQKLADAANQIRDSKLKEKIQYSRGTIEQYDRESAVTFELGIEGDIQALRDKLQEALDAATDAKPDPLKQALENTRDLMRGMESMDRRLREPSSSDRSAQGARAGGQQGRQDQEQQGQGQEGQAGDQQGRQGQGRQGQAGDQQARGRAQQGAGRGGQAPAREGGRQGRSGAPTGGAPGGSADAQPDVGSGARPGAPTGLRPLTDEDIRQLTRELRERAVQADTLSMQLRAGGQDASGAQAIRDALQRLEQRGVWNDPAQAAALQAEVLESLKRLEFSLRREVEGVPEERATLQGSDEVPDGYRKLVEQYYKALAGSAQKRRGGGGG